MAELLRLEKITKSYGNERLLSPIDVVIHEKECHVLLGDSDSGRSTIINIMAGRDAFSGGAVYWRGEKIFLPRWQMGEDQGTEKDKDITNNKKNNDKEKKNIVLLNEKLALLPHLNIIDNMAVLYRLPLKDKMGVIIPKINYIMATYGFQFDIHCPVRKLSLLEQLEANMVRCLYQDAKLMLVDNIDNILLQYGKGKFRRFVKHLIEEGVTLIYGTDNVENAFSLADEITLLKQNRKVLTFDPNKKGEEEVIALIDDYQEEKRTLSFIQKEKILLSVDRLDSEPAKIAEQERLIEDSFGLNDINFSLRAGEVIGIIGLANNGDESLFSVLRGTLSPSSGEIKWHGDTNINDKGLIERRQLRIGFVSKNPRERAVAHDLDVFDNVLNFMVARAQGQWGGFIKNNYIASVADNIIRKYDLPFPDYHQLLRDASLKDVYRFIIGRELSLLPEILILQEPFYGVDRKTIGFIIKVVHDLVEQGGGVIVISQEVERVLALADTIHVLAKGNLSAPYDVSQQSKDFIESLMMSYGHRDSEGKRTNS